MVAVFTVSAFLRLRRFCSGGPGWGERRCRMLYCFLQFGLAVALNQAGHNRKKKTCRESTHQHAGDAFCRAHRSPSLRENKIRGADGGITGGREVDGRFPSGKTIPAIKAGPQQNLQHMQTYNQTREPDYEHGGTHYSESANAPG